MSVFIKMDKPSKCGDCMAFVCYRHWSGDRGDCFCGLTKNSTNRDSAPRNKDCPLIPVPEHGRLIDVDAYIAYCAEEWIPLNVDAVNAQPTIIPSTKEE